MYIVMVMNKKSINRIGQNNALWYTWPAPMAHLIWLWHETQRYWVRIPAGSDICHWGYAYTVLQTVQKHVVCRIDVKQYSLTLIPQSLETSSELMPSITLCCYTGIYKSTCVCSPWYSTIKIRHQPGMMHHNF